MPPRKRTPVKPLEDLRRAAVDRAVEAAFERWRNRPGRATSTLVREALADAAEAAYAEAVDARGDG
jgi:acyl-CoA reductase-like NAD-dependent aldehyde dehydrogenase